MEFDFFFKDAATTEIYTLSLHDALPISHMAKATNPLVHSFPLVELPMILGMCSRTTNKKKDRKSTRLNSSHQIISYAVFCLKKKKKIKQPYSIKQFDSRANRHTCV